MKNILTIFALLAFISFPFLKDCDREKPVIMIDNECYCYYYYPKQAKLSSRKFRYTCDDSILKDSVWFEIFKEVQTCEYKNNWLTQK